MIPSAQPWAQQIVLDARLHWRPNCVFHQHSTRSDRMPINHMQTGLIIMPSFSRILIVVLPTSFIRLINWDTFPRKQTSTLRELSVVLRILQIRIFSDAKMVYIRKPIDNTQYSRNTNWSVIRPTTANHTKGNPYVAQNHVYIPNVMLNRLQWSVTSEMWHCSLVCLCYRKGPTLPP